MQRSNQLAAPPLFQLLEYNAHLNTLYRGLSSLCPTPNDELDTAGKPLAIECVAVTEGHVAVATRAAGASGCSRLAVLDACHPRHALAPLQSQHLQSFLYHDSHAHTAAATVTDTMLLSLTDAHSHYAHLQCVSVPHSKSSLSSLSFSGYDTDRLTSLTRFLSLTSDGVLSVHQWHDSDSRWSSLAHFRLPTITVASTHTQPRTVTSAYCSVSAQELIWAETTSNYTAVYCVPLTGIGQSHFPINTFALSLSSVSLIPVTVTNVDTVRFYGGQHGLFIAVQSSDRRLSLYYYHSQHRQLRSIDVSRYGLTLRSLQCHPHDGVFYGLKSDGEVFSVRERVAGAGFDSVEIVRVTKLALSSAQSSSLSLSKFFAFQQLFGLFAVSDSKAVSLALFNGVTGQLIDSLSLSPALMTVADIRSLSVLATRHGLCGTGCLIHTGSRILFLKSSSISQQWRTLTARTPYDERVANEFASNGQSTSLMPSMTFASPSFASPFQALSNVAINNHSHVNNDNGNDSDSDDEENGDDSNHVGDVLTDDDLSLLIPNIPYPYHSDIATKLSSQWHSALESQHLQYLLQRWIGLTTARHASEVVPNDSNHDSGNNSASEAVLLTALPLGPTPSPSLTISMTDTTSNSTNTTSHLLTKEYRLQSLHELLDCLSSPALPLSLLTLPSMFHYQHGHVYDALQWEACIAAVRQWLSMMDTVTTNDSDSDGEIDRHAIGRLTPLTAALLPLLTNYDRAAAQLQSIVNNDSDSDSGNDRELLLPPSLQIPQCVSVHQQLTRAVSNRATVSTLNRDRSLHNLSLNEPPATLAYLESLMGIEGLNDAIDDRDSDGDGGPELTPNLLLLNEEIKLKKELGVFGFDVSINSAALQRNDSVPIFELLCRLFDRVKPANLVRFVDLMRDINTPSQSSQSSPAHSRSQSSVNGSARQPRPSVDWSSENFALNFQRPIIQDSAALNDAHTLTYYYARALRCLPPIDAAIDTDSEFIGARVDARCRLYQRNYQLVEAILLRLQMARKDAKQRARHEEAAIVLASQITVDGIRKLQMTTPVAIIDEQLAPLRAEIYNHCRQYFEHAVDNHTDSDNQSIDTSNNESASDSENDEDEAERDWIHDHLDPRIRALRAQPLPLKDYYGIIRKQLASQRQARLALEQLNNRDGDDDSNDSEEGDDSDGHHSDASVNNSPSKQMHIRTNSADVFGVAQIGRDLFRLGESVKNMFVGPSSENHSQR